MEKVLENNGALEVCKENADNSESSMKVNDEDTSYEKFENISLTKDNQTLKREEELFSKLGLTKYMERNDKISLQEVMSKSLKKRNSMNDIPWYVFLKMLMIDYRGRDEIISAEIESSFSTHQNIQKPEKDFIDDFEEMFSGKVDDDSPDTLFSLPHPMDVLVAVILCSSDFLRQILCEKLFMCKLSIPLVIPPVLREESVFLLWSLRSTVAKFTLPGGSLCETSVVDPHIPIVSCLRLGEISRSKSKFLNEILNDQSHPTFFHRDCSNGINTRILSEGTIEIAWYFPSQKTENIDLRTNLALLNLRGDGKSAKTAKSVEFLCKISSIVLVMIDVSDIGNSDNIDSIRTKLSQDTKLILLLTKQPRTKLDETITERIKKFVESLKCKGFQQENIIFDFNIRSEKNIKHLKNKTNNVINKNLAERTKEISLEDCIEVANSLEIRVDENTPECSRSKKLALSVVKEICKSGMNNLKAKNLPLQCRPWQEWAKLNTEKHRREKRGIQNMDSYLDKISNDMRKLRQEQLLLLEKPNILCGRLLNNLSEPVSEENLYFLQWMKLLLDKISRQTLPDLQKKCSKKWNEIRQCEDVTKQSDLRVELDTSERELAESYFGLEHFMREIAQAYESVHYTGKEASDETLKLIQCLPSMMAELMLLGYPLEIMDGDAAHIPMKWVQAVLAQVSKRIGNKKIFVVSVLGIQSSGKSTLLNAMFGLQFAVAAGRCTRGVFAQLLPVSSEYSGTSYDYILVVDTEGLRAAELGKEKIHHDNEIATLVIGLGDITMVNVKGENVSEMEDVLEIVVHALMKMSLVNKNLKLQPSCLFIHQNVSAQDASQKLRIGQQKLIETLDKVTKAAGKQEDNPQYTKFKQLIDFDINKDIWYIPDLWKGDPPMAPVNPGYSENIDSVKQRLMTDIMQKRSLYLTADKFSARLKDLCHGILDQNFVFSFKNSLEMDAYNFLERELSDILWLMKSTGMEWFNIKRNLIGNSDDKLAKLCHDLESECRKHIDNAFQEAEKKLDDFFTTNEDRSILEQWRANSSLRLKTSYSDIINSVIGNVRCEIEKRKIQVEQKKVMKSYINTTMKDAQKLAEELRQEGQKKLSEEELELKFREKWNEWMKDVPQKETEDLSVVEKISDTLERHFKHDFALLKSLQEERCQETARDNCVNAVERYSADTISFSVSRVTHFHYNHKDIVLKFINNMIENVKRIMSEMHEQMNHEQCAQEVLGCIYETLQKLNEVLRFNYVYELHTCLAIFSFQYASYPYSRISTFEPGQGNDQEEVAYGILPVFEQALLKRFPKAKDVMRKFKPELMQQTRSKNFIFDVEKHTQMTEGKPSNVKEQVQKLLDNLFDEVESYTDMVYGFQELYIEEIIHKITAMERKCNDVNFTKTFRIQLAIYLCQFSLPKFCEKQKRFEQDRDQRFLYERDNYGPCFERFKNFYFKFTNEQALANVLSERVGKGIENAVNMDMARALAKDVKSNVSQLQLKPVFLKSVLHQLLEVDEFEEFYLYLNDYCASTEKWLCYYIDEYLFAEQTNAPNRYTQIASQKVESLVSEVCKEIVSQIPGNNENSLLLWIKDFHSRVKDKLALPEDDLLSLSEGYEIVSLETFSEHFSNKVLEHQNKIKEIFSTHTADDHKNAHEDNVYKLIGIEVKGCTERCPFCSAPCSRNTPGHEKGGVHHIAVEHYPQACGGYKRLVTNRLVTKNCTAFVDSWFYAFSSKDTKVLPCRYASYRDLYPDWDIHGDASVDATPYWKWFLVKYEAELANRFNAGRPSIPSSWTRITKEDAENSIVL
ncbi:interferon-induced very large GTPase 1-like [Palaemon carinicauda]|uniref:interferon-induced very large GTPase 1-like n=1 Tax=Palaemon carinicauda TaxID=392227 RepID=UPI0035B5BFE6